MWNTYRSTQEFEPGTPWLLRFFDQIRFTPVSAERLLEIRDAFPHGQYPLQIETDNFHLREYHDFLLSIGKQTGVFKKRQHAAFLAERERWAASGHDQVAGYVTTDGPPVSMPEVLPEGCRPVFSPVTASVWKIAVETGQKVEAGQKLVVLEAMKMEIAVELSRN
jgi:urea carboxylase